MTSPSFAIVTPSYQQGVFIKRTIDSILQQEGVRLKHYVFDGGSSDETVAILQSYGDAIDWVSEKDGGQADAVNKAIAASEGDIIGWINSDDIYYPMALKTVADFFAAHPDVDVVYGMADHIDENDQWIEDYPSRSWDFEALKEQCFICQPALFFRRRVVEKHGALDANRQFCMDYEYWLRMGRAGVTFAYLPVKLAGSRLYADNKTLGSRVKVHAEINRMFVDLFGIVPDKWLVNYAYVVLEANGKDTRHMLLVRFWLLWQVIKASWHFNRRLPWRLIWHNRVPVLGYLVKRYRLKEKTA